jgi:myo-inositol 2-dehydrogenase/D-chiro-inositol 1-dehydrogenase
MGGELHVGIVGVGRIGVFHLRTLLSLTEVGRVTVADADPSRAQALAGEPGPGFAPSPQALIESRPDAIVIATATAGHAPLLRAVAAGGIPAFCEKPVATDLATLDALIADPAVAGAYVQIGFQRRFDPGYRAARELVRTGSIGTILVVRAATHDPAPPSEDYIAGSGGIFRDLHIHDFDAIRFVTGEEVTEVYADGAVRETPWFADHDDFDAAVATMRLSGGALGVLSGARHDALGYDVRLEVFGTRDSVTVGLDAGSPIRSLEPGVPAPVDPYPTFMERFAGAYREELAAFVAAVREGGTSPCTLADARAALVVALAADRSRSERRPIRTGEVAPGGLQSAS